MTKRAWFLVIILLTLYPIAELTRLILTYNQTWVKHPYTLEVVSMWFCYLVGLWIVYWRMK